MYVYKKKVNKSQNVDLHLENIFRIARQSRDKQPSILSCNFPTIYSFMKIEYQKYVS